MWSERFLLPGNVTWDDFHELKQKGIRLPQFYELFYVLPLAGILYLIRILFER